MVRIRSAWCAALFGVRSMVRYYRFGGMTVSSVQKALLAGTGAGVMAVLLLAPVVLV